MMCTKNADCKLLTAGSCTFSTPAKREKTPADIDGDPTVEGNDSKDEDRLEAVAMVGVGLTSVVQAAVNTDVVVPAMLGGAVGPIAMYIASNVAYFAGLVTTAGVLGDQTYFDYGKLWFTKSSMAEDYDAATGRAAEMNFGGAKAGQSYAETITDGGTVCQDATKFINDDVNERSRISWTGGGQAYTYSTSGPPGSKSAIPWTITALSETSWSATNPNSSSETC